jgi:hypothetical protein
MARVLCLDPPFRLQVDFPSRTIEKVLHGLRPAVMSHLDLGNNAPCSLSSLPGLINAAVGRNRPFPGRHPVSIKTALFSPIFRITPRTELYSLSVPKCHMRHTIHVVWMKPPAQCGADRRYKKNLQGVDAPGPSWISGFRIPGFQLTKTAFYFIFIGKFS